MVPNNNSNHANINIEELVRLARTTSYENMTPDEQDVFTACIQRIPIFAVFPMSIISGAMVYKSVLNRVPKPIAPMLGISTFAITVGFLNNIFHSQCKLQALKSRVQMQAEQVYTRHPGTVQNATRTRPMDPQINESPEIPSSSSDFHETTADTFLSDESIETMIASQTETSTQEKPKYSGSYEELLQKHRAEYASKQLSRLRTKQPVPAQPQEPQLQSVEPQLSEPVFKSEFDDDEPKTKRGPRVKRNKYGDLIE